MSIIKRLNNWILNNNNLLAGWASIITLLGIPLIVITFIVTCNQLIDVFSNPKVDLEFVGDGSPNYFVHNKSNKIAEEITISFQLFDLDSSPILNPIPLPTTKYDYVNPKQKRGPFALFSYFQKSNHRYFGWLIFGCKDCEKTRRYFIYVVTNQLNKSFYYDDSNLEDPVIIHDTIELKYNTIQYLSKLIPIEKRKYIPIQ